MATTPITITQRRSRADRVAPRALFTFVGAGARPLGVSSTRSRNERSDGIEHSLPAKGSATIPDTAQFHVEPRWAEQAILEVHGPACRRANDVAEQPGSLQMKPKAERPRSRAARRRP